MKNFDCSPRCADCLHSSAYSILLFFFHFVGLFKILIVFICLWTFRGLLFLFLQATLTLLVIVPLLLHTQTAAAASLLTLIRPLRITWLFFSYKLLRSFISCLPQYFSNNSLSFPWTPFSVSFYCFTFVCFTIPLPVVYFCLFWQKNPLNLLPSFTLRINFNFLFE